MVGGTPRPRVGAYSDPAGSIFVQMPLLWEYRALESGGSSGSLCLSDWSMRCMGLDPFSTKWSLSDVSHHALVHSVKTY